MKTKSQKIISILPSSLSTTINLWLALSFAHIIIHSHIFQKFTLHEELQSQRIYTCVNEQVILYGECEFPYKITSSRRRSDFIWKSTFLIQNYLFIFFPIFHEALILYGKRTLPYIISTSWNYEQVILYGKYYFPYKITASCTK